MQLHKELVLLITYYLLLITYYLLLITYLILHYFLQSLSVGNAQPTGDTSQKHCV
jgi:hypothetical protein